MKICMKPIRSLALAALVLLMIVEAGASTSPRSVLLRKLGTVLATASLNFAPMLPTFPVVASEPVQSEGTSRKGQATSSTIPKGIWARARTRVNYRPRAYSVEPSSPPSLQPRTLKGEESLLKRLGRADVLLLGMDPEEDGDYVFVSELLTRIQENSARKVVIGLDGVATAGRALDAEAAGKGERTAISAGTSISERETRLTDYFLELAKEKKLHVVPCGVDPGTIKKIISSGFESLSDSERERYVSDTNGFVTSVTNKGFKRYADAVIADNYAKKGAGDASLSSEKFFALQILQNEGTATTLSRYAGEHAKEDLVVLVTDLARLRFGFGVQDRTKALLKKTIVEGSEEVLSILVNPSASETLSQSSQLRLSLAYGKFLPEQRMLADFVWFSKEPPLKLLTRPKNPINKEGDKPPGESSVIGAFNARK